MYPSCPPCPGWFTPLSSHRQQRDVGLQLAGLAVSYGDMEDLVKELGKGNDPAQGVRCRGFPTCVALGP